MDEEIEPDDEVVLENKMNIAEARKDIDTEGDPYDILEDVGDMSRVSEWAIAYAMYPHKVGDRMVAKDFDVELQAAVLQQYMDRMVELGYMEAVFTDTDEEIGYRMTAAGNLYAAKKRLGL